MAPSIQINGRFSSASYLSPRDQASFQRMLYDLVIPIPLSHERYQQRGFNQVTAVLQAAGIDYRSLLKKKIHLPYPPQAAND